MSWLGLRDATGGMLFAPAEATPQGTLAIDFRYHPSDRPINILRHARRDPVAAVVTLRSDPDGTLSLLLRQGERDALHSLSLPPLLPAEPVSVHYLWTGAKGIGAFAAHLPDRGLTSITEISDPLPLSAQDVAAILTDQTGVQSSIQTGVQTGVQTSVQTGPGLCHVAIADHLAPVGPQPVLHGGGIVDTPDGPQPLHRLRRGDRVIAADGGPCDVLWIGSAEVPSPRGGLGHTAPHLLRAPYFGVQTDLAVSGAAVLRLGGSEVEYLFGKEEVAVAVRHLADGRAILPLAGKPDAAPDRQRYVRRWHQVVLDRAVPLRVSGAAVETPDLDRFRQDPVLHRWSLFAGLGAVSQRPPALCLRLRDYEARTLWQMQAA